jgi:multidrug efflux system membrane fusion protein
MTLRDPMRLEGTLRRRWPWLIVAIVVVACGFAWHFLRKPPNLIPDPALAAASQAVPVTVGTSAASDVPVYLTGLGTVQAFNTVTVKVRVDGQLDKVAFTEGQDVNAGDILAQIDPRPFQAALDQAIAAKARDEAQLANARLDLQRFVTLGQFATKQSVDTQQALVRQLEATVQVDQAAIESAQVQLDYTTIKAPLAGRTGIRLLDAGNIVHAADPNGLVVLTQLQPISVIFSLPDDQLRSVLQQMASGPLQVTALARTDQQPLGEGTLTLVDNQIDQTTGTIRLKATFPNDNHALWPGQFVTVRLLIRTLRQAVTVPTTAVQRGPDGMYVYVIKPDSTVAMQPVNVAQMAEGISVIEKGLETGASIVVAGQYRLTPGNRVRPSTATAAQGGG